MEKSTVKLASVMIFFKNEEKLISKAENSLNSGYLLSFKYNSENGSMNASVRASMKDKVYDVKVLYR